MLVAPIRSMLAMTPVKESAHLRSGSLPFPIKESEHRRNWERREHRVHALWILPACIAAIETIPDSRESAAALLAELRSGFDLLR